MLTGSQSFFVATDEGELDALAARAAEGDLQPTGPLWGDGESPVTGEVAEAFFTTTYNGEEATWRLTFSDYGEPVEIPIPSEIDG